MYSSECVLPHTFSSSNGSPAARTNTRTDMLLTLGGRMFSFTDMTDLPSWLARAEHIPRCSSVRRVSTCIRCGVVSPQVRALRVSGRRSRCAACLGFDQLGVDEASCPEVHSVLLFASPPEGHADVADHHRLGAPRAPALFELRTERRLAAAGLTRYEDALDARPSEVDPPFGRPFHEVSGV